MVDRDGRGQSTGRDRPQREAVDCVHGVFPTKKKTKKMKKKWEQKKKTS